MQYCKRYYSLLLLASFSVACAIEKEGQQFVGLEETFSLSVADTIQFKDAGTSFWISLQEVRDSRCPENVNCITAGKATVILALEGQSETMLLCQGGDCSAAEENLILIDYNNRWYNIVLEEVVPYPGTAGDSGSKETILKIKRATG